MHNADEHCETLQVCVCKFSPLLIAACLVRARLYIMPVQHLVFLRLAADADGEAVMDALRGLVGVIPGLISFAGGANTSKEGGCNFIQKHAL